MAVAQAAREIARAPRVLARTARVRTGAEALAAVTLSAVLLAPLLATRIPFLVDYPNHLARMHVLATGAHEPALHAIFRLAWAFIPNMVMDLAVPVLAQVMPLDVAGRLFIALAILLPPVGVIALHRAWFGRRAWWPWIGGLASTNAFLMYGFLNYLVGVGLALLGAAWHARVRRAPGLAHAAVAALWGTACLLSHIFAFGVLVLLMLSNEAGAWERARIGRRVALLGAAVLVPLALYSLFGPAESYVSPDALGTALGQIWSGGMLSGPRYRAVWLLGPFTGEGAGFGLAAAALLGLPLLWAIAWRRLAAAPQLWLAFVCLLALYLLLPSELVDNAIVYERLILPVALVAIAGVWPCLPRRTGTALAVAVSALVLARSAAMAAEWHVQSRLLAQVEAVIARIPPGARVLAVRDGIDPWHTDADEPSARRVLQRTVAYTHLPALVTLERDAFWPMIFTVPGKQPLALQPAYEALAQSDGYLPLTSQLGPSATVPAPRGRCQFVPAVLPCQLWSWPRRYDYVLRLNAHADAPPQVAHLRQIASEGWATLYRVQ